MKKSIFLFAVLIFSFSILNVFSAPAVKTPDITTMKKYPGFFNFYWDKKQGKIWLEIDKIEQEFLLVTAISAGLGSNAIGLDRNQLRSTRVVKFYRSGPRILLIEPNYGFRAGSDNLHEKKAVQDAFAFSVIWGFEASGNIKGKILVDSTNFFLHDNGGIGYTLKRRDKGNYRLDKTRSVLYLPRSKNFPQNTEVESILTFTADTPGEKVWQVAPDANSVSLRLHYSFIKLPDHNFKPRIFDPRCGYYPIQYLDYATPIDQPVTRKFICRHRLQKKDPQAKISDPLKPIDYYLDRGVPEPIRSALIEGALWWNEAFEKIGYKNAFQVKILPEDADPLDIRYNMINWVHRSTRGWSYGGGVIDPRTGEIIKGQVALGSLRVRQDYLIAKGLVGDFSKGNESGEKMKNMALLRIKQLSCHEVGHTLGLAHNYASSVNNRASVMDYPHPLVKINADNTLDIEDAYTRGIGAWDRVVIHYGYQDFSPGTDEKKELKTILNQAFSSGLYFLSDRDAWPADSAHPLAHLWDNGRHPIDELKHIMKVRKIALEGFSQDRIPEDTPLAVLEDVLVPIYLLHRYQIQATAKVIGGLYYNHSLKGDNQKLPFLVPPREQKQALDLLLKTLEPENLILNEEILKLIPPRPPGYSQNPDLFSGNTGPTFDPLAAAQNLASLCVGLILNPQRAARLIEYHARDPKFPGLLEVMDRLISATWKSTNKTNPNRVEIQKVVNNQVLFFLKKLAADKKASNRVRGIASYQLEKLKNWLQNKLKSIRNESRKAHYAYAINQIILFQKNPEQERMTKPLDLPEGPPI